MVTGQGDFWNYDFSHIPVELLSGLYESFLSSDQQENDSAYYTPRHLAVLAVDQALAASQDPLSETGIRRSMRLRYPSDYGVSSTHCPR